MKPLIIIVIAILGLFILMTGIQGKPSFPLLFPILVVTFIAGWYLNRQIQKDHEENLKRGVRYEMEEKEAQHWLHHSFVPKTKLLLQRELKIIIAATGIALLLFTFVWSFFISGLLYAVLYTLFAILVFALFVVYVLHSDKFYKKIFNYLPRSLHSYRKNDWVHGYVLLLPFVTFCIIVYSILFSAGSMFTKILTIPLYMFFFTLFFICLYCLQYLYREFARGEEK
jgi:hypothetical protein